MPANLATSPDLLVSTDFPLDKIVVGGTVNFTVPAATTGIGRLPHNLPFAPLMMGSYSYTSDYAILYGLNSAPLSSLPTIRQYDSVVKINSDANDIIFAGENYTANPVTFYVRYYGLEPSTVNADIEGTRALYNSFQLNSDYNYTKLYMSDYRDFPTSGSPYNTTVTIPHNLGKIPQVIAWREGSGTVAPLMVLDDGVLSIENAVVSVDTVNLYLKITLPASQPLLRVHYRVYLDE